MLSLISTRCSEAKGASNSNAVGKSAHITHIRHTINAKSVIDEGKCSFGTYF